jgi:hypothetical protein
MAYGTQHIVRRSAHEYCDIPEDLDDGRELALIRAR